MVITKRLPPDIRTTPTALSRTGTQVSGIHELTIHFSAKGVASLTFRINAIGTTSGANGGRWLIR
jgi:hypothetical protein